MWKASFHATFKRTWQSSSEELEEEEEENARDTWVKENGYEKNTTIICHTRLN